mmetsp:Transcript_14062/g.48459  ORF Transcript_14062/g.48459 Transcript_14062/m.48459 type:complete len:354 (-) Transcript_14062:655-1716(-)
MSAHLLDRSPPAHERGGGAGRAPAVHDLPADDHSVPLRHPARLDHEDSCQQEPGGLPLHDLHHRGRGRPGLHHGGPEFLPFSLHLSSAASEVDPVPARSLPVQQADLLPHDPALQPRRQPRPAHPERRGASDSRASHPALYHSQLAAADLGLHMLRHVRCRVARDVDGLLLLRCHCCHQQAAHEPHRCSHLQSGQAGGKLQVPSCSGANRSRGDRLHCGRGGDEICIERGFQEGSEEPDSSDFQAVLPQLVHRLHRQWKRHARLLHRCDLNLHSAAIREVFSCRPRRVDHAADERHRRPHWILHRPGQCCSSSFQLGRKCFPCWADVGVHGRHGGRERAERSASLRGSASPRS